MEKPFVIFIEISRYHIFFENFYVFGIIKNEKKRTAEKIIIYNKQNRWKIKEGGGAWGRMEDFFYSSSWISDEFFWIFLNFSIRRKKFQRITWKIMNYESFFMSLYLYTFCCLTWKMLRLFFISWNILSFFFAWDYKSIKTS